MASEERNLSGEVGAVSTSILKNPKLVVVVVLQRDA